jgi:hypothetical protein
MIDLAKIYGSRGLTLEDIGEEDYWDKSPSCYMIKIVLSDNTIGTLEYWLEENRKHKVDYFWKEEWDYDSAGDVVDYYVKFYIANTKDVTQICLRWPIEKVYAPFEHD